MSQRLRVRSVSGSFSVVIATALCVSSGACSSYNTCDNKCFLCSDAGSDCAVTVALAGINTLREAAKRRAADLQHQPLNARNSRFPHLHFFKWMCAQAVETECLLRGQNITNTNSRTSFFLYPNFNEKTTSLKNSRVPFFKVFSGIRAEKIFQLKYISSYMIFNWGENV